MILLYIWSSPLRKQKTVGNGKQVEFWFWASRNGALSTFMPGAFAFSVRGFRGGKKLEEDTRRHESGSRKKVRKVKARRATLVE